MSDEALERIEKALKKLSKQQEAICEKLEQLERKADSGGSPTAEVPQAIYAVAMESLASTEKTDIQKLQEFISRFPDIDVALKPIHDLADRLDHDPETQSLLANHCPGRAFHTRVPERGLSAAQRVAPASFLRRLHPSSRDRVAGSGLRPPAAPRPS